MLRKKILKLTKKSSKLKFLQESSSYVFDWENYYEKKAEFSKMDDNINPNKKCEICDEGRASTRHHIIPLSQTRDGLT